VNIALWISQVLLALGFLFAGWMHAIRFQEAKKQMAWVRDVPEPLARLIGAAEILGAIGLILPALTRILPWLTPLAASGLALLMILASAFHISRNEWRNLSSNLPLLALALFVAVGRFFIAPL
jgi:uncharacterized membrane protein YphA (DoxX/SURF4 family)